MKSKGSRDLEKGLKGFRDRKVMVSQEDIPVDTLKQNLVRVCGALSQTFSDIRKVGAFQLKQVVIGIEVSAEGGIALIGTAKAGGKGAITLTFEERGE